MSKDDYRAVPWSAHDLEVYPCGVRAGTRLRLRKDLAQQDHTGRPTGKVYPAGGVWQAIQGMSSEPEVVWLLQPDGAMHTWDDDSLLDWFEVESEPKP